MFRLTLSQFEKLSHSELAENNPWVWGLLMVNPVTSVSKSDALHGVYSRWDKHHRVYYYSRVLQLSASRSGTIFQTFPPTTSSTGMTLPRAIFCISAARRIHVNVVGVLTDFAFGQLSGEIG
jgi:hypothetical protein